VLSTGTFRTPQILERSGIGSPEILKHLDIPVVASVPGVGREYNDHMGVYGIYRVDAKPDDTGDQLTRDDPKVHARLAEEFKKGTGPYSSNYIDGIAKIRPSDDVVSKLGPKFVEYWNSYLAKRPNAPVLLLGLGLLYSPIQQKLMVVILEARPLPETTSESRRLYSIQRQKVQST
jgi:alcohol oxidase